LISRIDRRTYYVRSEWNKKFSVLDLLVIKSKGVRESYPGFTRIFVCRDENRDRVIFSNFIGSKQTVSSFWGAVLEKKF